MTLKVSEIKKLLALSHKLSVKSLKVGEFEVHFEGRREARKPNESVTVQSGPLTPTNLPIGAAAGVPTDDEFLFMSSPLGPPNINTEDPEEK